MTKVTSVRRQNRQKLSFGNLEIDSNYFDQSFSILKRQFKNSKVRIEFSEQSEKAS
jgi:hypothetical protein